MNKPAHEGEYDEYRNGPRHSHNFLSFPEGGLLFKATEKVWEWDVPGAHEQEARRIIASPFVEALFAEAPVPDPSSLKPEPEGDGRLMITKCLATEYIKTTLQKMIEAGLTTYVDEDGCEVERVYEDIDELYEEAAKIMKSLQDDPEVEVSASSFDWLEGFGASPEEEETKWFSMLTLEAVTNPTKTLKHYCLLNLALGPHATKESRIEVGGTCHGLIGGEGGGQLGQAVKKFYNMNPQAAPAFVLRRLLDFLRESEWPDIYRHDFTRWDDYAYDLSDRALWPTATRQEWTVLVQNKMARTLKRDMPTLTVLFHDYMGQPNKLVREVESLGDLVLTGLEAQKLPLYNLERLESMLTKTYGEIILAEEREGSSTEEMLHKVWERAQLVAKAGLVANRASDAYIGEEAATQGPKPGQLTRATAAEPYVTLEVKYLPKLQTFMSVEAVLEMFGTCLTARTMLPHAVLFATKGKRIVVYTGHGGTDFLALLHAKRFLLARYIGQSLAYSQEAGGVPSHLKHFECDPDELVKLTEFKWWELDFFNKWFLRLMGAQVGTEFQRVSTDNLYHRADMLLHVQEVFGKLFACIGFPDE